jgi:hypothetical protein
VDDYLISQLNLFTDYDDHFLTVNVRDMHRLIYAGATISAGRGSLGTLESEKGVIAGTLKLFILEKL